MTDNKTLLGKLGFDDNDLKTPEHDKILDVIINDAVISKIANIIKLELSDNVGRYIPYTFVHNDKWQKQEEYILKTKSGFVVGAIDLHVQYGEDQFKYPFVIMNIEVKTFIQSTGELIRQVNVYRTFTKGEFVIIAPSFTDSQKNRLKEAGIYSICLSELTKEGDL